MPENESDIFRLLFHGKYVSDFDDIKNEKMRSQVIHLHEPGMTFITKEVFETLFLPSCLHLLALYLVGSSCPR